MIHTINPADLKANFSNAKILIIEDNDDHWLIIQHAINQCLPEVTPFRVATAQQALALLHSWQYQEWEHPKLILLDLYLPDSSDGWQLLEAIKQLPSPVSLIPVVMFSASPNTNDIFRSYSLGVASYLVKPLDVDDWLAYFQQLRSFWWETTTLPRSGFMF